MANSVHVYPDATSFLDIHCLKKYLSWSTGLKELI